jgi:exosome complex component RRP41
MTYEKRFDGRDFDETRETEVEIGLIPRADGSAKFCFGNTKAIATIYGPRLLHPQHHQDPEKAKLRCSYDLISFSVSERKKPGPSRRSTEVSHVIENSLNSVIQLESFPGTAVDLEIEVIQADASTRCAGINAASLALAHAGIPMTDLISSVSVGCIGNKICIDITKKEEDYEEDDEKMATDIPMAFSTRTGKMTLLQLDGKIKPKMLKEAIDAGFKACLKINEIQKKALRSLKLKE